MAGYEGVEVLSIQTPVPLSSGVYTNKQFSLALAVSSLTFEARR
ncbi:hypothetical protein [Nostoc sp. MS1]|nr:hypothetical protein [Nostoc sp. MS1]